MASSVQHHIDDDLYDDVHNRDEEAVVMPRLRVLLVAVCLIGGLLAGLASPPAAEATHAGDAGQIAFVDLVDAHDEYGSRAPEIFVADADGSNPIRLTFDGGYPANPPGVSDYELTGSWGPAWSPDGQQIAFVHRDVNRKTTVEIMLSDGTGRTTLSESLAGGSLTWSPDGRYLALMGYSSQTGETGVWTIRSNGSDPQLLLPMSTSSNSGFWALGDLDWSPSGTHLAFIGRQANVPGRQLYTMRVDGTDVQRLTCADNWVGGPSWSPHGDWIAASCGDDLYQIAADGSSHEPLVISPGEKHTPVWSPDGSEILYLSAETGAESLWSFDVATGQTMLVGDFSGSQLDWQPLVRFTDIVGSQFRSDIEWLADAGITRGCNPPTNDRFCPSASVTRGQMAAFLVRALGYADAGAGDLFVDDDDSVFEGDIDRLGTAGVTRGCNPPSNDRFCPDKPVTRGQMAAFLVRALGYAAGAGSDRFLDDDGSTFEADIEKLAEAGVTLGCNPPANDQFCPDTAVTRGQMAAFLHRALGA